MRKNLRIQKNKKANTKLVLTVEVMMRIGRSRGGGGGGKETRMRIETRRRRNQTGSGRRRRNRMIRIAGRRVGEISGYQVRVRTQRGRGRRMIRRESSSSSSSSVSSVAVFDVISGGRRCRFGQVEMRQVVEAARRRRSRIRTRRFAVVVWDQRCGWWRRRR